MNTLLGKQVSNMCTVVETLINTFLYIKYKAIKMHTAKNACEIVHSFLCEALVLHKNLRSVNAKIVVNFQRHSLCRIYT